MKGCIPVEIPTKKYIKAYIISQLGEKPLMSRENAIGSKMIDLLQHKTNKEKTRFPQKYSATLRIYIGVHTFKQRGCFLNETNIQNFNNFVEDMIKERYRFLMDFYFEIFPSFEDNLPVVRNILGIDDDHWSDDSMKKDYYRYRKRKGKPLIYKKIYSGVVPDELKTRWTF